MGTGAGLAQLGLTYSAAGTFSELWPLSLAFTQQAGRTPRQELWAGAQGCLGTWLRVAGAHAACRKEREEKELRCMTALLLDSAVGSQGARPTAGRASVLAS